MNRPRPFGVSREFCEHETVPGEVRADTREYFFLVARSLVIVSEMNDRKVAFSQLRSLQMFEELAE